MKDFFILGNWTENIDDNSIEYDTLDEAIREAKRFNKKMVDDDGRSEFKYEVYESATFKKIDLKENIQERQHES